MKLFSRKALLASATALAMTISGTAVANAADESTAPISPTTSTSSSAPASPSDKPSTSSEPSTTSTTPKKEKDGAELAKEITAWIGVATAILGVLGTLFSFVTKYFNIKF